MERRLFDNPAKRAWWQVHIEAHRKSGASLLAELLQPSSNHKLKPMQRL
jgi:hypothetical protein